MMPGQNDTVRTAMLSQLEAMPPGPERDAAVAQFVADYAGQEKMATQDRNFGEEMAMSPMAQGTQTGGKYGTYVAASPLEHLASGLRQFKGFKDVKDARADQKASSAAKQKAMMDMLSAQLRSGGMGGGMGAGGQPGMTPQSNPFMNPNRSA
jgi:hypothetical protein